MHKYIFTLIASIALLVSFLSASEDGFVPLFNGTSFDGWMSARSTGAGDWGEFSINEAEQAIHCYQGAENGSEQSSDCLNTLKTYSHYILKLEYKWQENKFIPRTERPRDAGVMYHVHGDLTKVWPLSLEMQIGETPGDYTGPGYRYHTGDLFVVDKQLQVKAPRNGEFYDPSARWTMGGRLRTKLGIERPMGEWNELEIQVHGAKKATYILNGEVVLELADFQLTNSDGIVTPLDHGHICLQAEWAEIMYRKIRIKELPASAEFASDHVARARPQN